MASEIHDRIDILLGTVYSQKEVFSITLNPVDWQKVTPLFDRNGQFNVGYHIAVFDYEPHLPIFLDHDVAIGEAAIRRRDNTDETVTLNDATWIPQPVISIFSEGRETETYGDGSTRRVFRSKK